MKFKTFLILLMLVTITCQAEDRMKEICIQILEAQDRLSNNQRQVQVWKSNVERARVKLIQLRAVKQELEEQEKIANEEAEKETSLSEELEGAINRLLEGHLMEPVEEEPEVADE